MFLFVVNLQGLIPRKKGEMQRKEKTEGGKRRKRVKGRRKQFFRCLRKMSWFSM
jgi:hypothetical protein